jgi:uncharacterized protein (TIGR02594 family)
MNATRREALAAVAGLLFYPCVGMSESDDDTDEVLRNAIRDKNAVFLGHKVPPPTDESWSEVDRLLRDAPSGATPYDVASYFLTSIPPRFQQAWPEPDLAHPTFANPLIVRFFLSTRTIPEGDTTAWCGAFVNWCLQRVGVAGTRSAGSQSFADWGEAAWSSSDGAQPVGARRGDIAVFRRQSNPTHGHVAFFQGLDASRQNRIEVLGGNQFKAQSPLHVINVESLRVDADLELIAIRTSRGLRNK